MAPAEVFRDDTSRPIQQGDIFLLPLPANPALALPEAVVDLWHRTTADRLTLTERLASLTGATRPDPTRGTGRPRPPPRSAG